MTTRKLLALLLTACFLAPLASAPAAHAQDERSALIAEINGLRASYGLAPYSIDPSLMAMAQEHSEYQASIHQSTHLHSDGRTPPELGVVENVAGGTYGYVTAWDVVYNIWVDPGHLYTMTGYASGMMGVGVANDGETTYFTLELIPTGVRLASPPVPGSTYIPVTQPPPPKATPLVTATPHDDGSIVHVVGYGQTLWSIAKAYGVSVDQLRTWNNIAADDSTIYAGQRLMVRPAGQFTPAPVLTPPGGTATPSPSASTGTPKAPVSPTSPVRTSNPGTVELTTSETAAQAGTAAALPAGAQTPAASGASPALFPLTLGVLSLLSGLGLLVLLLRKRQG